jgi:hypothetical protein
MVCRKWYIVIFNFNRQWHRHMILKKVSQVITLVAMSTPILLFGLSTQVLAQANISNFHTYANTDYGFTIKYPSDWKVDENMSFTRGPGVKFTSHDGIGSVVVIKGNLRPNETGMSTYDWAKFYISHKYLPPEFKLIELNSNNYFLSDHPAIRL